MTNPFQPLFKMPRHIRTSAGHFAEFIEMNADIYILEHAADILRHRIDMVLDLARQRAVDNPDKPSTMGPPTQEPPQP